MKEHAELLSSVRDDISEYKVRGLLTVSILSTTSYVLFLKAIIFMCFDAGVWEYVTKNAIIKGTSFNSWKYISCKLKCLFNRHSVQCSVSMHFHFICLMYLISDIDRIKT